jgi:hypothetical protein
MEEAERKPVDDCANYLLHYSPYLHYDKALAEGVPIATGVIEGACRHLVEDRMNLTGARWSLTGAEAVLRLRALRSSDDFDAYWKFHEQQEYERHHASRYAGHRVPETVPPPPASSQRRRPGTQNRQQKNKLRRRPRTREAALMPREAQNPKEPHPTSRAPPKRT